ncbi:SecDF P1 head subdomain-containing protein [Costertonia aggregata]|uniref:SecDF P1 head subdomain domain-containing protein n=1 Tax=Costertonia aggregata TaxID=343403 RepID=A0A7H9ARD9_9FLAO|nr:hypothetical protein [Costertonia aggregata]QLG46000.1 hypothetical protein HYG79_11805 [Costertonia aggregata]
MRNIIFCLVIIHPIFCFSQNLANGFYQVDETYEGRLVRELDDTSDFYVVPQPILVLDDFKNIQARPSEFGGTHNLIFELKDIGSEKFKNFTQKESPTQMALLMDSKLISKAIIQMPIPNGTFILSGLDFKKARATRNKLLQQMGKSPLFAKGNFTIYSNRAIYDGKEIYNTKTDYNTFMEREAMPGSQCDAYYSSYYNPLSLVGDFYSYEWGYSAESACGSPGNMLGVKTTNDETGTAVSLLQIVEEEVVVAALKKDSWVTQQAVSFKIDLENVESFSGMLDFFKAHFGVTITPSSFCILGYEKGMVKIRLVGVEYVGYSHHRHLQLGFEVPVKEKAKPIFSDNTFFYLGKFKNGLYQY